MRRIEGVARFLGTGGTRSGRQQCNGCGEIERSGRHGLFLVWNGSFPGRAGAARADSLRRRFFSGATAPGK